MADGIKRAKKKTFDFTNVKDRGSFNPKRVDAGDYRAKIIELEVTKSKAGDDMWIAHIQLEEAKSYVYPYYMVHDEGQLWKIRTLFIAAGVAVPKSRKTVDPEKLIGKKIGVQMEDDEYDGKLKSIVQETKPLSALEDLDDGEDVDPDDIVDDDDDVEEEEIEEVVVKKKKKAAAEPPVKKKKKAPVVVEEDDDEDEAEEDDDDEEEEEPVVVVKKKKKAAAAPVKKAKKKKAAVVEDDDDDDDDLDDLEVDDL